MPFGRSPPTGAGRTDSPTRSRRNGLAERTGSRRPRLRRAGLPTVVGMATDAAYVVSFGCRSGSDAALVYFGAIFGLLGLLVLFLVRRRHPAAHRALAPAAALAVFLTPMALIYAG